MPRCSSAQRSVASAWREKRKQVVSRVRGICDDVTCPFLHSGVVQVLKAGQVHTNDPFCCLNSPLQSSYIWFAGWPKPYSYRRAQNRLNNSRVKLCHVHLWQVELFQLTKEEQPYAFYYNKLGSMIYISFFYNTICVWLLLIVTKITFLYYYLFCKCIDSCRHRCAIGQD